MNSTNVASIYVLAIRYGIYVHIVLKIANDGLKHWKITNNCVKVNRVMEVRRVFGAIQVLAR